MEKISETLESHKPVRWVACSHLGVEVKLFWMLPVLIPRFFVRSSNSWQWSSKQSWAFRMFLDFWVWSALTKSVKHIRWFKKQLAVQQEEGSTWVSKASGLLGLKGMNVSKAKTHLVACYLNFLHINSKSSTDNTYHILQLQVEASTGPSGGFESLLNFLEERNLVVVSGIGIGQAKIGHAKISPSTQKCLPPRILFFRFLILKWLN